MNITNIPITGQIILVLFSITFWLIRLNKLFVSNNKMTSLWSLLNIDFSACTAVSLSTLWPAQSCKSPAVSRMFLLNIYITVQPRVLHVTSPISIGFTTRFVSKEMRVHANKASSNPTFLHYLIKYNFFAMSAVAPQISRLFWPNYDKSTNTTQTIGI